jgi:hypothetical protein
MWIQCVSKLTRMAMPVMIACALAAVTSAAWAANGNKRDKEKNCSNQTLDGDYGFTIEGLLDIPGTGIQVRGVALGHYDGNGHITLVDHVVVDGMAPSEAWRPGTGTYTVNADCTGKATITIPSSPAPPLVVYFVVVRQGKEIRQVVERNAVIATGKKLSRLHFGQNLSCPKRRFALTPRLMGARGSNSLRAQQIAEVRFLAS